MVKPKLDIIYIVASELGSIGMGSAAYNAIKGIEDSKEFSFKVFCRGNRTKRKFIRGEINSYGYLEYLSYPLRFLEKKLKLKINSFLWVNYLFGKKIYKNLQKCKIYHTWMGISPESVMKAKKEGAILVLEGANSHPMNSLKILNEEYNRFGKENFILNPKKQRKNIDYIEMFDYVLCPSDFVYNSFLEQGFKKEKLIKIPYGVDIRKFTAKKEKPDKKFRAIFVGSIQLRKGAQYLLRAWRELNLKNAELILVGSIYPDAINVVKEYNNDPTIKFRKFNSNLREYYKKSDLFVFPSIEEGSALVNYEAMASGLPIITTFNSGSIVRDEKEGFIIPIRDVKSLKEKIKFMYENPEKCLEMGKSARKRVEEFTWTDYGKKLVNEYKKILKRKSF